MKQETERKQERKKTENKQTEPKKRWYDEDLASLIEADWRTACRIALESGH